MIDAGAAGLIPAAPAALHGICGLGGIRRPPYASPLALSGGEGGRVPQQDAKHIRVGVGGWTFEPWRGAFYPDGLAQKRELEYAASKLTSIEVNGTYYGSQKPESFAKWRAETPDGFIFALKGPRFATNRRVLAEAGESIERFFKSGVTELKEKLGPINWQFMATKKFDPDDFAGFLKLLPKSVDGHKVRHAVEVRHDSFKSPDFIALAREHEVAIVLAGDSEFPQIADITAPFVYARIMGTVRGRGGGLFEGGSRPLGEAGAGAGRRQGAGGSRNRGQAGQGRPARGVPLCDQRLQGAQSGRRHGADRTPPDLCQSAEDKCPSPSMASRTATP